MNTSNSTDKATYWYFNEPVLFNAKYGTVDLCPPEMGDDGGSYMVG